jgi:two-component system sensor histidine kinase CreC
MRLGTRIFLVCLLIFTVCFSYPVRWFFDNLRVRYLEGVEDPLVDQANILAVMVGHEMERKTFDREKWYRAFENVRFRSLSVKIYNLLKTDVDMRIYITDASGKIVFDSEDRENLGIDYSEWRDVRLTLDGKYGARSTAANPLDPRTKVLYVAAPVMVNGALAGVLTVAKPTTNINNFLTNAKPQIVKVVAVAGLAAVLLSYLASLWITPADSAVDALRRRYPPGKTNGVPGAGSERSQRDGQCVCEDAGDSGRKEIRRAVRPETYP